jgi:DNA invertase Pin-like site-specific DNA recombinase
VVLLAVLHADRESDDRVRVPQHPIGADGGAAIVSEILVAYYRVSTKQQGFSGLGLDAQRAAVTAHVRATGATIVATFTEVESGTHNRRPQLQAALLACRTTPAVLVIAKLDRLARSVAFLAALMDGDVEFRALDLPGASRFHLHIMAAVAEQEAQAISDRTTVALRAAKARGTVLGTPANLTDASRQASIVSRRAAVAARQPLLPALLRAWRQLRWSLPRMAAELSRLEVALPRGGCQWSASQVGRVLAASPRARARARADDGYIPSPNVGVPGAPDCLVLDHTQTGFQRSLANQSIEIGESEKSNRGAA